MNPRVRRCSGRLFLSMERTWKYELIGVASANAHPAKIVVTITGSFEDWTEFPTPTIKASPISGQPSRMQIISALGQGLSRNAEALVYSEPHSGHTPRVGNPTSE